MLRRDKNRTSKKSTVVISYQCRHLREIKLCCVVMHTGAALLFQSVKIIVFFLGKVLAPNLLLLLWIRITEDIMEFRAYFKHMDSSLATFAYAEKKLTEKVEKFVKNAVEGHITFSEENETNKVHFHLVAGGGFNLDLTSENPSNMYSAIDAMVEKVEKKLRRHKEKLRNHKFKPIELKMELEPIELKPEEDKPDYTIDAKYVIEFEKARRSNWPESRAQQA